MKMVVKVIVLFLVIIVILMGENIIYIERKENFEEKVTINTQTPVVEPTATETITPSMCKIVITEKPEPVPTEVPFSKLAPTILMSTEELIYDDQYIGENPNPPFAGTYKMVINVYYQFITVLKQDQNGKFTSPVRYMICSTGKKSTPTPTGIFAIEGWKTRIIGSEGYYARYATRLTDDIYFHSLLYTDDKKISSYTPTSYKNLGKAVSHGCIRLWVPDAKWIYYNIAPGTEIEVIEGQKDEKEAAIRAQLIFPKCPK